MKIIKTITYPFCLILAIVVLIMSLILLVVDMLIRWVVKRLTDFSLFITKEWEMKEANAICKVIDGDDGG